MEIQCSLQIYKKLDAKRQIGELRKLMIEAEGLITKATTVMVVLL